MIIITAAGRINSFRIQIIVELPLLLLSNEFVLLRFHLGLQDVLIETLVGFRAGYYYSSVFDGFTG